MKQIQIDFEVWKELTARLLSENDSYNGVLRRLLQLKENKSVRSNNHQKPLVIEGIEIPSGTQFKKEYKDKIYTGEVIDGYLVIDGKKYTKPSPAAMDITDTQVNGWRFWKIKFRNDTKWLLLDELRNK